MSSPSSSSASPAGGSNDGGGHVWYFAYGSNMSSKKFTDGRHIVPLARVPVRIPGWALTMEVPNMPYSEPGMSSVAPLASLRDGVPGCSGEKHAMSAGDDERPAVCGVAYLITRAQWVSIVYSEGGGIAYDSVELAAEPLAAPTAIPPSPSAKLLSLPPSPTTVTTLVAVPSMSRRTPDYFEPLPSARYLGLLRTGAEEAGLPAAYQEHLARWPAYVPPPQLARRSSSSSGTSATRRSIGAAVFLALCVPLLAAMERLCYATISRDTGLCPPWVRWIVRRAVALIWWLHDRGFAPVFGPGDGSDQTREGRDSQVLDEKTSLLEKHRAEDVEAQRCSPGEVEDDVTSGYRPFWER